jgi:hypothetical protein
MRRGGGQFLITMVKFCPTAIVSQQIANLARP